MKRSLVPVFLILLFLSLLSRAQENAGLEVGEMVFCRGVEDRQPVGTDTLFSNDVERIFCFTRITGAEDTTAVSHVWYRDDEEKARVELAVKSKSWRTWSSKRIMKDWTGIWRVEVVSSSGDLLRCEEFLIKPSAD